MTVEPLAVAEPLAAGVWRLDLPSRTLPPYRSTNSYLLEAADGAYLVDPGSEDPRALAALDLALATTGLDRVVAVLLTHTHRDHLAGLSALLERSPSLPIYVHPLELDRVGVEAALPLAHGRILDLTTGALLALHTPGHSPGSVSLLLENGVALVGDLLAGSGSSWIGRPEGSVADYLASVAMLTQRPLSLLAPGHGPPLSEPQLALRAAHAHRLGRETQILELLTRGEYSLAQLRSAVYPELAAELHDAAERSLLAHLDKLIAEGRSAALAQRNGAVTYLVR